MHDRWVWWSQFAAAILDTKDTGIASLENILTSLNFNTPEYINWLWSGFKKELLLKETIADKLDYLSAAVIRYKLMAAGKHCSYMPAAMSLKWAVLAVLKAEINNIHITCLQPQNIEQPAAAKLNTALSVPQLALFIRLMVDTKIIIQPSQLALLKQIAPVIGTAKVASISPKSLRVNYYTPENAAKNIVKDYLINMINCLRTY